MKFFLINEEEIDLLLEAYDNIRKHSIESPFSSISEELIRNLKKEINKIKADQISFGIYKTKTLDHLLWVINQFTISEYYYDFSGRRKYVLLKLIHKIENTKRILNKKD